VEPGGEKSERTLEKKEVEKGKNSWGSTRGKFKLFTGGMQLQFDNGGIGPSRCCRMGKYPKIMGTEPTGLTSLDKGGVW